MNKHTLELAENRNRFIDAFDATTSIKVAAAVVGLTEEQANNFINQHPELATEMGIARAKTTITMAKKALKLAKASKDPYASIKVLEKRLPEVFSEKANKGKETVNLNIDLIELARQHEEQIKNQAAPAPAKKLNPSQD